MDEQAVVFDARLLWHLLRQNGRCLLCGEALFLEVKPPKYGGVSREHKIPKVHGGTESMSNIGASHCECNFARGNSLSLRRFRPPRGGTQPHGRKWRAQLFTASPAGLWWTQRATPFSHSASLNEGKP